MLNRWQTRRLLFIQIVITLIFLSLGVCLFYLQVIRGNFYTKVAQKTYTVEKTIPVVRGLIYDRAGRVLVLTYLRRDCYILSSHIKNKLFVAQAIAKCFPDMNEFEVMKVLRKNGYVLLRSNITQQQEEALKALKRRLWKSHNISMPIDFYWVCKRYYPQGELGSQLFGFVRKTDNKGLEGLEYYFDRYLSGREGRVMVDSNTQKIVKLITDYREGNSLVLSIDAWVQKVVEDELRKGYSEFKASSANAIVLIPDSGEVLAMATVPTFNPNNFQAYTTKAYRNSVVVDLFEPGSVFKPIVLSFLLKEGIIGTSTTFSCEGGVWVKHRYIKCWHRHGANLSLADIIAHSCNSAMIKMSEKIQTNSHKTAFYNFLKKFNFLVPTDIDFPGEAKGLLIPLKEWSYLTLPSLSIGQSIAVSPLQLAMAYAAIANNGNLLKPVLVKAIIDHTGKTYKEFAPHITKQILPEKVTQQIKDYLKSVVKDGTARAASIPGIEIAGKTGTAQKAVQGKYKKNTYITSFVGFFPADAPKLLILVTVNEPKTSYYASTTAVVIFKRIVERLMPYLEILPQIRI